jgi:hypothetical protein
VDLRNGICTFLAFGSRLIIHVLYQPRTSFGRGHAGRTSGWPLALNTAVAVCKRTRCIGATVGRVRRQARGRSVC